jgi:ribose 1,5-bisphosphokinase
MTAPSQVSGTLVLVVGSSGAGKDTVLRGAQAQLREDRRIVFPQRTITRPADAAEDHISASREGFSELARRGAFAFSWSAHGLKYGVPASIERDLKAGKVVACNVSRHVIAEARSTFGSILVAEVRASLQARAARLAARQREDERDIATRLSRDVDVGQGPGIIVPNEGSEAEAIASFVLVLKTAASGALVLKPKSGANF